MATLNPPMGTSMVLQTQVDRPTDAACDKLDCTGDDRRAVAKKTQKSANSRVLNKLPERILFLFHYTIGQRIAPGAARRYAPRRWQFNPKIAADLRPSADRSTVPTYLVAGGG